MPSARPSVRAITSFITAPSSRGDVAPASAIAASTIARQLALVHLGRQVRADQRRLVLLLACVVLAAALAEAGRALFATLALAPQQGDLVLLGQLAAGLHGGLLQRREQPAERRYAVGVARLARSQSIFTYPLGEAHPGLLATIPSSSAATATACTTVPGTAPGALSRHGV